MNASVGVDDAVVAKRPTVVQFGAGAIGRGFVGQLWSEGGYEVVFVDVDRALIDALNVRRAYPLRLLPSDAPPRDLIVGPVQAVDGRSRAEVRPKLLACAFACTAVGVNAFQSLAPLLAAGIAARAVWESPPLNILCCENQAHAAAHLRKAVAAALFNSDYVRAYFDEKVAFVDASVGRMVPPPTTELRAEDPLLVAAEPYAALPVDAAAWLGNVPPIPGLQPRANFAGYAARKLFTHNGGHTTLAYHGYLANHEFIYQAAEDPAILAELQGFWRETGDALVAAYGFDPTEQRQHEADLLARFRNRALGDTILRVARDPKRKLRPDDRLVGAALLCQQWTADAPPVHVCRAIAAALNYDVFDDRSALEVQQMLWERGLVATLETLCGLPSYSPLIPLIRLKGGEV